MCALAVMRTTVDLRRAPWHRNAQRGPPLAGLRYEDPPPDALWSKMEQLLYTVHRILRPQTFADYYTALANYGVVPRQVLRLGPKAAAALQAAVREVALRGTGNQYKAMELSEGLEALARAMSGGILCEAAGRRHWLEVPIPPYKLPEYPYDWRPGPSYPYVDDEADDPWICGAASLVMLADAEDHDGTPPYYSKPLTIGEVLGHMLFTLLDYANKEDNDPEPWPPAGPGAYDADDWVLPFQHPEAPEPMPSLFDSEP